MEVLLNLFMPSGPIGFLMSLVYQLIFIIILWAVEHPIAALIILIIAFVLLIRAMSR